MIERSNLQPGATFIDTGSRRKVYVTAVGRDKGLCWWEHRPDDEYHFDIALVLDRWQLQDTNATQTPSERQVVLHAPSGEPSDHAAQSSAQRARETCTVKETKGDV